MFILTFLAIIGVIIAAICVYAAVQAVKTDWGIRRDSKRYYQDRQKLLDEIIIHLDNLMKNDYNSEKSHTAISTLKEIVYHLKNY